MKDSHSEGYDAPVYSRGDDLLGRWNFAQEIAHIALDSPKEWSIRVGIYGEWGTGKTSVMNFCRQIARENGHYVFWFNPWEYESPEDMWPSFVSNLLAFLKQHKIHLPNTLKVKSKGWFAWTSKNVADPWDVSKTITGLPLLRRWAQFCAEDFVGLKAQLGEKRLLIIIDDLDRTDSRAIPQLLVAVRQIMDIAGVSYLLAFDPKKVASILSETYGSETAGEEFLDKVIDFPRWLPAPSREALISLARKDLDEFCPFVDKAAFSNVFDLIQPNPRKMRQFVRYLWTLETQVKRHNPEEIDWTALTLLTLIKATWPKLAPPLVDSNILMNLLVARLESSRDPDFLKQLGEKNGKEIDQIFQAGDIVTEAERERARSVIIALSSRSGYLVSQNFRYLAYLTEQPHAFTWREFDEFYAAWIKAPSSELVKSTLNRHASARQYEAKRVSRELFETTISFRHRMLGKAVEAYAARETSRYISDAQQGLEILRVLGIDLFGFTGSAPFLEHKHFEALMQQVASWHNFENTDEYKELRERERQLLLETTRGLTLSPEQLLQKLAPWNGMRVYRHVSEKFAPIFTEVCVILWQKLAQSLLERLKMDGGMAAIFGADVHYAEHYLLLNVNGPLLKGQMRGSLLDICKAAAHRPVIQQNLLHYIELIYDHSVKSHDPSLCEMGKKVVADREVIIALWKGATCTPLNPRVFGSFKEYRNQFNEKFKAELPLPLWYSEGGAADEPNEGEEVVKGLPQ